MSPDKEKWVNEVMASADQVARANSRQLADRVMDRITDSRREMPKEQWVEQALSSLDGLSRAKSPDMLEAVEAGINAPKTRILSSGDSSLVWKIAASVALILVLNTITIVGVSHRMAQMEKHAEVQEAAAVFGMGQVSQGADPGSVIFGN